MKIRIKKVIIALLIFAAIANVLVIGALSRAEDTQEKITGPEPVPANEIYGVRCRLLPDKDEWQANEIPRLKAYIPGPGNGNLWLATIIQQDCWLKVDEQWYRYMNPEWTGGVDVPVSTDWLVQVGGFLSVSFDKAHWVTMNDSKPLAMAPGEHAISLGWAGYKADPNGGSDYKDNPILLISEPVQIQIIESKEPGSVVTPGEERYHQVVELFEVFLMRESLTEVEQELGLRTDLRSFHSWRPDFTWKDIPALLELAEDEELLDGMPSLMSSSYMGQNCRKGMVALWLIEGLRREQITQTREEQLKEKLHIAWGRLPLNPICIKEGMGVGKCESSVEIQRAVLQAYRQWWSMVESFPAGDAAAFYPLDMTDVYWYGAGDRWPESPLEIYEKISSDGTAAERTIKHLQKVEGTYEYEPGKIMQVVYYTLKNPGEKPPFTSDMLKIQKVVLRYYNDRGEFFGTIDIVPGEGRV
ncbi:MAG: DUF4943 family protein [Sedimentisphaerales bacterium]|nr:DUF4943 family protein [Sedimentisphaerales bacterium]